MVSQMFAVYKFSLLSNAQYFLITATHQYILETDLIFSEKEVSHSPAFENPLLFIYFKRREISEKCIFSRLENAVD
jgi:hypothetical protein